MPNRYRLCRISLEARQVTGQFEAFAFDEQVPRFGGEDVSIADP